MGHRNPAEIDGLTDSMRVAASEAPANLGRLEPQQESSFSKFLVLPNCVKLTRRNASVIWDTSHSPAAEPTNATANNPKPMSGSSQASTSISPWTLAWQARM
jgi:hypothetical protein